MSRWRTLDGRAPRVIAHRGASGHFPEHVLAGYRAGLDLGADIIEPDLVMSRDGVLVCRHDLGLARSTDIARRPELAARRRDGDWWCWDLDAAEILALGAVQPFPGRDRSLDGRFSPPSFHQALAWAAEEARARGHEVVLYPELKHPRELAARGLDPVPALLADCARLPAGVALLLQCFDPEALRRMAGSGWPVMLLVDAGADPEKALREHGRWLSGLALCKRLLTGPEGEARVERIHAAGLTVDAWTVRDDRPDPAFADVRDELRHLMGIGVDRLFCDFPATAVAERARMGAAAE